MSDEFDTQPVAEGAVAEQPAEPAPVVAPPVPANASAGAPGGSGATRRPAAWVAAVAAAAVLAFALSAVSFGAGVFVGRQTGRFDGRVVADGSADLQRGPGMGRMPQGQMDQDQGGRGFLPDGSGGGGSYGQGMPGPRGQGRGGFPGSPDGSATMPPMGQ